MAASAGVIVGVLIVVCTLSPGSSGSLSGQQVGNLHCPAGDYCPLDATPKTFWLPAGDSIDLNWTSLNGTTVSVTLFDLATEVDVGSCYWPENTAGSCSFVSSGGSNLVPYDLGVGAVRSYNGSPPEVDYTFAW
jgi:hypothetical protein